MPARVHPSHGRSVSVGGLVVFTHGHNNGAVTSGLSTRVMSTFGGRNKTFGEGRSVRHVTRTGHTFTRFEFWLWELEGGVTGSGRLVFAEGVNVVTRVSTNGAAASRHVLFCANLARGVNRARSNATAVS